MTANQINFAKLKEDERSHRANEAINRQQAEAATSQAATAAARASEDQRAHQATESINWFQAAETQRHNREGESVALANLMEAQRSNYVREEIQRRQLSEQQRANRAQESFKAADVMNSIYQVQQSTAETARANRERERQKDLELRQQQEQNLRTSAIQARSAEGTVLRGLAAQEQAKAAAANVQVAAYNAETSRIATALRSDELAESIRKTNVQLAETTRHNQILENQGQQGIYQRSQEIGIAARNARSAEKNAGSNRIRSISGAIKDISGATRDLLG